MNLTGPRIILSNLGITSKMLVDWTGYSRSQISQVLNNHRDTPVIQEAILEFALPSVPEKDREKFTLDYLFGAWSYKARRKRVHRTRLNRIAGQEGAESAKVGIGSGR